MEKNEKYYKESISRYGNWKNYSLEFQFEWSKEKIIINGGEKNPIIHIRVKDVGKGKYKASFFVCSQNVLCEVDDVDMWKDIENIIIPQRDIKFSNRGIYNLVIEGILLALGKRISEKYSLFGYKS